MSSDWISRLVVCGPTEDVQTFAKAATDPLILRERGRTPWEGERRLGLSFKALQRSLAPTRRSRPADDPDDPWDLCVEPLTPLGPGTASHTYKFQTSWEPDRLLVDLSSTLSRLCFVLGSVDPATDTQESLFIQRGHLQRYRLPDRQRNALAAQVPADAKESEALAEEFEADWAMMDAVMAHWERKVAATLRRVRPRAPARASRAPTRKGRRRP